MPAWLLRMAGPLSRQLTLRIWLAVVLSFAVLVLVAGWVWRVTAEPSPREVVLRDASGAVIGRGELLPMRPRPTGEGPGRDPHASRPGHEPARPGQPSWHGDDDADEDHPSRRGPRFMVRMADGQVVQMHLPRPPRNPNRPAFDFLTLMVLAGVAVALATYPIIRTLTRRLQTLQGGVERWGDGDLSVRVPVQGHDEVAFLAQRFNEAAQRIESLVQANKSLLANASHELRSPLARIRMGLELIDGASAGDAAARAASRAEIARSIEELDHLIEEILLASRLDSAAADLGPREPIDWVGLCAEEAARHGAALEVDAGAGELWVLGHARLLRRAVRNLLENARRYGGGEVVAAVGRVGDSPAWAELRVLDRGPGVPVDQRERIFEPFYRLPGASERDGGVGLGLALVRAIAQRHGGGASCETRPDGPGALFRLRVPVAPAPPPHSGP